MKGRKCDCISPHAAAGQGRRHDSEKPAGRIQFRTVLLQGDEKYPSQALITHVANKAKNGAGIVEVRGIAPRVGPGRVAPPAGPFLHMAEFDLYDAKAQNYLSQLADAVHMYNSKICMNLACRIFPGYDVSAGLPPRPGQTEPSKELSRQQLCEIAEEYAAQAKLLQSLGYDMVAIHMAYRHQYPGRMLSPLLNRRTDEFGGSIENRGRFPLLCCQKIKEACGRDFPIQVQISAEENIHDPMARYDTLGTAMVDGAAGFRWRTPWPSPNWLPRAMWTSCSCGVAGGPLPSHRL